ncbi:5-oxoprolinase subunit B family protein [Pseudooctadecabacter sp.]|uniref:5-oxoprolinase subunit B family protein n=1 Tax=Pseudooctadecabacter sp. TaxID=1966338 RepID=UPI0025E40682|nr:allophanate hydrolase subunit 1 [Pseudooctadecabacter sp.]
MHPTFKPVADFGLLVIFGDEFDQDTHAVIRGLDAALNADLPQGVLETVPALVNLMVVFDPLLTDHSAVQQAVERCFPIPPATSSGTTRTIDVCYDDPFAPDLPAVAAATGLSEEAVISAHLAGDYDVLMFGFAPGYGYLGGVAEAIQVPRKPQAVPDVPAGAVMIAGRQCLVTTLTMPTGWSVIGRSPTPVLTDNPDAPILFDVGDRVRFRRISADTFHEIRHD